MTNYAAYAFCEPTIAAPNAPWCIRPVSGAGRKYGGGIDTASLCGRVKPYEHGGQGGWDVRDEVTEDVLEDRSHARPIVCPRCVARLREMANER